MPKPIVTLKRMEDDSWIITWWRYQGSCVSATGKYEDYKVAEAAAKAFAKSNNMPFLPVNESFWTIEKRNNLYWVVELVFEGKVLNHTAVANLKKERLIEDATRLALAGHKLFVPDFLDA